MASPAQIRLNAIWGTLPEGVSMSSFALPDDSGLGSSSEESGGKVKHSTLPFTPITPSRGKEPVGPEPELQAILYQAIAETGATGAAIALSMEDAVCCRASTGDAAPEVGTRLHAGSLTGLCLGTGQILLCNDTDTDRRVDPQLCKEIGIRSVLVLPIKRNARVVGVLEVLSSNPNAFNQHDAIAMSKLADRVLPLCSESETIRARCPDQPPSKDIEALRNLQKLLVHTDVLKENNEGLPTTDTAETPEWNGHDIVSQSPDQPVSTTSREHPGARWVIAGLATASVLAVIFGYGYHLNHPTPAARVTTPPIAAANHEPAIPPQNVSAEGNKKPNGQPKGSDSVLTASREQLILAIQEPVRAADGNRTLNPAVAGDSSAQYEMALRYADGEDGPQNFQDAMVWFAKAAANGNASAQWKLGLGYLNGIGVPHDERKAAVWVKRAANHGDIRAQSALSDLYLSGRGVPRDYIRAYTWASIAAGSRGSDNDRLKVIGSRMTIVQIEEAHRRISTWWERQNPTAASPANSPKTAVPDVSEK